MFISRFARPHSAEDIQPAVVPAKTRLPDTLHKPFSVEILPANHSRVAIIVPPRKQPPSISGESDTRVIALLSSLAEGKYAIEPKVDRNGWTFLCIPHEQKTGPCLTLRTDRRHHLERIDSKATGEEQGFSMDFEKQKEEHEPLPALLSLKKHNRCPQSLRDAWVADLPSQRDPSMHRPRQSDIALVAYEYLCELLGTPFANKDDVKALEKAADIQAKTLEKQRHPEPANISENVEKDNYESWTLLNAQRELAEQLACALLPTLADDLGLEKVPQKIADQMKQCWPPGSLKHLFSQKQDHENLAIAIASVACGWMGGAFNCAEIAHTMMHAFEPVLEGDEKIRTVENKHHVYNEYLVNGKSFRVDGWLGDKNTKTPVLSEHAYEFSTTNEISDASSKEKKSENGPIIRQLLENLQSNPVIQEHFDALLKKKRTDLNQRQLQGFTWENAPEVFVPKPVLIEPFREDSRKMTKALQERSTIDFELKTLNHLLERKGWPATPSTISAVLRATRKLMAPSSEEHAREFAQRAIGMKQIDASAADTLINEWLTSATFKPWEAFGNTEADSKHLLNRLNEAFEKMDDDKAWPAFEQLWKQLPALVNRHPGLYQEMMDMVAKVSPKVKAGSGDPGKNSLDELKKSLPEIFFAINSLKASSTEKGRLGIHLAETINNAMARMQPDLDMRCHIDYSIAKEKFDMHFSKAPSKAPKSFMHAVKGNQGASSGGWRSLIKKTKETLKGPASPIFPIQIDTAAPDITVRDVVDLLLHESGMTSSELGKLREQIEIVLKAKRRADATNSSMKAFMKADEAFQKANKDFKHEYKNLFSDCNFKKEEIVKLFASVSEGLARPQ